MTRLSPFAVRATILLAVMAACLQAVPAEGERRLRLQGRASIDRRTRVVGAIVLVQPVDDRSRVYITTTDDDGAFHIEGLPEGDYDIRFERPGFTPVVKDGVRLKFPFRAVVEVTMAASDDPVPDAVDYPEATVSEPIGVEGIVVWRNDASPIAEARVRFVHPEGEQNPRATETDAVGRFAIADLPPGPWELLVDAVGYIGVNVVLNLDRDAEVGLALVKQPASYKPTPFELMPPERLTPPPDFTADSIVR